MFFRAIYLNKTTVLIGQLDQFQGHEHLYNIFETYHLVRYGDLKVPITSLRTEITSNIKPKEYCGTPRYGDETRSKNISVKIWQRIS